MVARGYQAICVGIFLRILNSLIFFKLTNWSKIHQNSSRRGRYFFGVETGLSRRLWNVDNLPVFLDTA